MKALLLAVLSILFLSTSSDAGFPLVSIGALEPVPTFESIGLTVSRVGDDNWNAVGKVKYRAKGSSEWKTGYDMTKGWKNYLSGSLVHLSPGTTYEIQVAVSDPDGGVTATKTATVKTWPEKFPEGEVTTVLDRTTPLEVKESGTPNHYRVYQPPQGKSATIDLQKSKTFCVGINANYVIVRGLTLKNAGKHAVSIAPKCHDVIIENCDISEWGPKSKPGQVQYYQASAFYLNEGEHYDATRIIIQNNLIHHPTTGGTATRGPQAVTFVGTKANHVIRHNKIYSDKDRWLWCGYGAYYHWSSNNTEIYGNEISQCHRGLNLGTFVENKRIWGNVFHDVHTALVHLSKNPGWDFRGPVWIWRNLFYNLRNPTGQAGVMAHTKGPGQVRFFNNTLLSIPGESNTIASCFKSADGANFLGLNNIMDCEKPYTTDLKMSVRNTFNYNLYRKDRASMAIASSWEKNGIFGASPAYDKKGNFDYPLKAGSPGVDAGVVIPNFTDAFAGAKPDMGACEQGGFSLNPGPKGSSAPEMQQFFSRPVRAFADIRIVDLGLGVFRMHGLENDAGVSIFNGKGQLLERIVTTGAAPVFWNSANASSGILLFKTVGETGHHTAKAIRIR